MVLRNGKEINPAEQDGNDDNITSEIENELLQDDNSTPTPTDSSETFTVTSKQLDDLIKQRLLSMFGMDLSGIRNAVNNSDTASVASGSSSIPTGSASTSSVNVPDDPPTKEASSPLSSEQKRWNSWDAAYPTPTFSVRKFRDEERLVGHRNYKPWRKMVELDLAALNLTPFIKEEVGESIKLSPSRRTMLDAQTLQYLKASVSKQVIGHLQNVHTAFAAFKMLCKMFESVRALDQVQLHRKFGRLRFKAGFNSVRFCADFDHIVEEYKIMDVRFPDSYLATIFLEKIDGIFDPTCQYFSFFTTITALPPEIQTLSYIQSRFLAVDNMSFQVYSIGEKRKAPSEKENVPPKKFKQSSGSAPYANSTSYKPGQNKSVPKSSAKDKYTSEQLAKLRTMSVEEKRKIRCHNCGEYFHQGKDCKNPGRLCYACFEYGHEKQDCTNAKKKGN